jgi:hypothetical protein
MAEDSREVQFGADSHLTAGAVRPRETRVEGRAQAVHTA